MIAANTNQDNQFEWPRKVDLFGIGYSPTSYEEATDSIIAAATLNRSGVVSCHAVHALISASTDPDLGRMINQFEMVTPDGQPVRWAMNLLHATNLKERVYGPELTVRICQRAAETGVPIYLYGGSPEVVETLQVNLRDRYPGLIIAGYESPPYRALTPEEDQEVVDRINQSGAGIVFIGLGCPKQDVFAFEHRNQIKAVQICVGAAFDFHADTLPMAPKWMQQSGLEWLFRLIQEPKRLWKRYLITNSIYLGKLFLALLNVQQVRKQRQETKQQSTSTLNFKGN
ncbi:MAG: glycosyl transferase [Blastopirellula sp.]|nr:MAG: glycosyl transferase [Blastopirellula sp.]